MHKKCGLTWGYEMPQSLVMADSTTMVLVTNLVEEYSSPFHMDIRHGNDVIFGGASCSDYLGRMTSPSLRPLGKSPIS